MTPPSFRKKLTVLIATCYDDRGFGDCFGQSLVIQGRVEAMLDPVVKPYDVAAIKICVEEAGGRFTDLSGKPTIYGGNALSSNGRVHSQILRAVGYSYNEGNPKRIRCHPMGNWHVAHSLSGLVLVGILTGWVASKLVHGKGMGIIPDMVVGILGALLGGFLADFFPHFRARLAGDFRHLCFRFGGFIGGYPPVETFQLIQRIPCV